VLPEEGAPAEIIVDGADHLAGAVEGGGDAAFEALKRAEVGDRVARGRREGGTGTGWSIRRNGAATDRGGGGGGAADSRQHARAEPRDEGAQDRAPGARNSKRLRQSVEPRSVHRPGSSVRREQDDPTRPKRLSRVRQSLPPPPWRPALAAGFIAAEVALLYADCRRCQPWWRRMVGELAGRTVSSSNRAAC
jgi:hypothetical protein